MEIVVYSLVQVRQRGPESPRVCVPSAPPALRAPASQHASSGLAQPVNLRSPLGAGNDRDDRDETAVMLHFQTALAERLAVPALGHANLRVAGGRGKRRCSVNTSKNLHPGKKTSRRTVTGWSFRHHAWRMCSTRSRCAITKDTTQVSCCDLSQGRQGFSWKNRLYCIGWSAVFSYFFQLLSYESGILKSNFGPCDHQSASGRSSRFESIGIVWQPETSCRGYAGLSVLSLHRRAPSATDPRPNRISHPLRVAGIT